MSLAPLAGRRVAIVHGSALEQGGFASRTFCWLKSELEAIGAACRVLVPHRDGPSPRDVSSHDLVIVGDLGGVYGELSWVTALAALRAPLLLFSHGHPFCVDGTRLCGSCGLRLGCPTSDRVEVYRRLARAATHIVYSSPLHREVSESYLGAHPDKTAIIGPVAIPELPACEISAQRVAFARAIDEGEWEALAVAARREPATELVVYGTPPLELAAPANLRVEPSPTQAQKIVLLAGAAELVCLPERPLPFGEDAAAMISAHRRVTLSANVGLNSYAADLQRPPALAQLVRDSREQLTALVAAQVAHTRPAVPSSPHGSWLRQGRRVLVWAHHLGLGDSVNLLPFIQALEDHVGTTGVRSVLPDVHARLLRHTLSSTVQDETAFELARERLDADLIVEVTIYHRDAHADDILSERWLQIELARQPQLFGAVHENLLSALNRAGLAAEPRAPRLRHPSAVLAAARSRLRDAGCDLRRELVLAFHPGSGAAHKRWPAERFAALARTASMELGARVVLITGPGEDALAEPFEGHVLHSRAEELVDVAALLACCHAFVGNDSGLMHVACAAGCPALALFGPSIDQLWGPSHPASVVVAARDEEGDRHPDVARVTEVDAFTGLSTLLLRLATKAPSWPEAWIVASPLLRIEGDAETRRYDTPLASVLLAPKGEHDPIQQLLRRLPSARDAIAREPAEQELLETLLAAGVLAPDWVSRCPSPELVYGKG